MKNTELSFNAFAIMDLGNTITEKLSVHGINGKSKLIIDVDKETLSKIDEDLYYRNNPDDSEYKPAENELKVKFKNLEIEFVSNE